MRKRCIVCDAEFEARNSTITCSAKCAAERRKAVKRNERIRYRARYPEKRIAECRRYRQRKRDKFLAENPHVEEHLRARAERIAASPLIVSKACVVCGSSFSPGTPRKTCSDECWLENHRRVRRRPERTLVPEDRLADKRRRENQANAERRAALKLVRELQTNPEKVLL